MPEALATTDCAWFQLQWTCPSGALSLLQLRENKASPGPVYFIVFSMLPEATGKKTGSGPHPTLKSKRESIITCSISHCLMLLPTEL